MSSTETHADAPHKPHARIGLRETFGLSPLPLRLREAVLALRGGEGVPPSRFDLTGLRALHPVLSIRTWLGATRADRRIPISNLFNHTQTPVSEGWSVRKTQVRDFRGGTLSYDSHNGTDFAIPVGTVVVAAAPGRVLRISSEFNRGGLKVFVDHGDGLITTSNHLARALVSVGDVVARGQPVALSGYSGLDGLALFPWSVPHVHFNTWLNGDYVDPFSAEEDEPSLWLNVNDPVPHDGPRDEAFNPSPWNAAAVEDAAAACRVPAVAADLRAEPDLERRAMNTLLQLNYFPNRFERRPELLSTRFPRQPRLTLPFRAQDFVGIWLE